MPRKLTRGECTKGRGNPQSKAKKMRILSVSVDVHATLQMYQISKLFKRPPSTYNGGHTTLLTPFRTASTLGSNYRCALSMSVNIFLVSLASFICPDDRFVPSPYKQILNRDFIL